MGSRFYTFYTRLKAFTSLVRKAWVFTLLRLEIVLVGKAKESGAEFTGLDASDPDKACLKFSVIQ